MTSLRSLPTNLPMINVAPVPADDLSVERDLSVVHHVEIVTASPAETAASRHVMDLLAGGVPLSLLLDLADPTGPPSRDIASSEMNSRSLLGDLFTFRANAAEGSGSGAKARTVLRTLRLG